MVYRSNNNANANGGVSYANTNNDSSNTNANIGSRLANNVKTQGFGMLAYCIGTGFPSQRQGG